MKICAACHKHLPKESYSKKQWKLDECQRRCKVCITNNREIQPLSKKQDKDTSMKSIIKSLDSLCLEKEISDEDLFKQPPPREDCPICFLLLPTIRSGRRYQSCCGKTICSGCVYAPVYDNQGNKVDVVKQNECAFCRVVAPRSIKEAMKMLEERVEVGDAEAIHNLGNHYSEGI